VRKGPKGASRTPLSYSVGSNATKIVTRKSVGRDKLVRNVFFILLRAFLGNLELRSMFERLRTRARVFPERAICFSTLAYTHIIIRKVKLV
jgi:hypothetical protein